MKLLCVDFSNLIVRHASNPYSPHKDAVGRPVGGAVGSVSQVLRLVDEHKPSHLLIARDGSRDDSFRRELEASYKAHREDADDDLKRQFKLAYAAAEMFNWPCVHVARHEADDVIASACKSFPERCEVVSGDKDLLALCSDRVTVWLFRPGGPEAIDAAGCRRIMGVEPRQVRDYKSLVGDTSDGISGVAGIGPKTAIKLIDQYGSVASIYRHLDEGADLSAYATASMQRKLVEGREQARMSWQLAGLVSDLPVDIAALALPVRPAWAEHEPALRELGLLGLEKALTGKRSGGRAAKVDLDLTFRQLTFD